ncbi:ABC transporter [Pseudozyma hubeiensis SY62]|uniref:ABC transporter n=1 Tax=Pseudozyma hubeiensis (strain SY62) TaxID=1305764 RepID=R9PAR3_PSEHS|nr:ABC transporter [Pseudozyma hubeiensis SY62]GAC98488.1 ABC transporter [Pseudozyma hubeiensis SY62]
MPRYKGDVARRSDEKCDKSAVVAPIATLLCVQHLVTYGVARERASCWRQSPDNDNGRYGDEMGSSSERRRKMGDEMSARRLQGRLHGLWDAKLTSGSSKRRYSTSSAQARPSKKDGMTSLTSPWEYEKDSAGKRLHGSSERKGPHSGASERRRLIGAAGRR